MLGYTESALVELMGEFGAPAWRARSLLQWIHRKGETDFNAMTDFSVDLREQLSARCCAELPQIVEHVCSEDGTRKWLIKADESLVEAVLIPEGTRRTLCVSSQVGCSLNCSFCATGMQGFARNLRSDEIIGQVWAVQRELEQTGERISNVVMMGMGEPLMNFEPVVDAMDIMLSDYAYGLSKQRVTLSTSGLVPQIDRLSACSEVSLALSLHAPDDALRNTLVPINRKYPIAEVLAAVHRYVKNQSDKRVVTIEYILLSGVNDSPEQARALVKLLRGLPCKINLIPYNCVPKLDYKTPDIEVQKTFQNILREGRYITTLRTARGADIDAACGQLAGSVREITRRQARQQARVSK